MAPFKNLTHPTKNSPSYSYADCMFYFVLFLLSKTRIQQHSGSCTLCTEPVQWPPCTSTHAPLESVYTEIWPPKSYAVLCAILWFFGFIIVKVIRQKKTCIDIYRSWHNKAIILLCAWSLIWQDSISFHIYILVTLVLSPKTWK